MIKWLKYLAIALVPLYLLVCLAAYSFQESLLFHPRKLKSTYEFNFPQKFEEVNIEVENGININGLLFSGNATNGVVLFLHGNGGNIKRWAKRADDYLKNDYDVLFIDYRGYGKSKGKIISEAQLYADNQIVYDFLKSRYDERTIIVKGYSIGSGMAAKLASVNNPKMLILMAPYYSLKDLINDKVPWLPQNLSRYHIKTNEFLNLVACPIKVMHGTNDRVIPVENAKELKHHFGNKIELQILENASHFLAWHDDYLGILSRWLN